ncbi:MAG: M1 family metallopeptidase, partial [Chitinophagales bacterium]|nr:M1 family metallopeptidase [Chitinophagales bacterium]
MTKIFIFYFILQNGLLIAQITPETSCYVKDPKGRIREHNIDFKTLSLNVSFEPEKGKVTGTANYTFTPIQLQVDTLFLDAPAVTIHSIKLNNANIKYRTDSAGVIIYFDPPLTWETTHTLQIDYTATPRKGLYFIGWNKPLTAPSDDPNRTRKQIWTQGQGVDNRFWIPSYDDVNDKLITDITVTFDTGYRVISNGNLSSSKNNPDNTTTWHYVMTKPHALYLIMLGIGEYAYKDYVSENGITSRQYFYPDREEAVDFTYRYSAAMMDWLEAETGVKYPWESYANVPVQEFIYGAMENTTATIFSDYYLQDERSGFDKDYDAINAHELTHQWFGDYVTEFSGTSHWLHESFATYYAKIFMRSVEGDDAYAWNRRTEMLTAMNADNKDVYPLASSQAGSARHYQKGSYVLDMLRYVAGDEQYKKVIREYLLAHPYDNVTNYDLQIQFMKTLGMNLDWFFDEWIYKNGYPEYTVSYAANTQKISVHIKQIQKITETWGLFKMPVHIEVYFTNGIYIDTVITMATAEMVVDIPNKDEREISYVLFDPGHILYSKVDFKKENAEWMIQAKMAKHYIDRYDAIVALRLLPADTKIDGLLEVYKKEKHFGIRAEIIAQLIGDENSTAVRDLIRSAIYDPDAEIRKAVLVHTTSIPKKLQKDYETLLQDFSYVNMELALRLLCNSNPGKKNKYLATTKNIAGMNKNVRITWLEINYGYKKDNSANELVSY